MKVGIIGFPNVGKTTIFNALTRSHAASDNYPFCTIEPNVGAVSAPDPRLERLAEIMRPEKTIAAQVEFLDVAGLVEGASRGEGLGNRFLGHIREANAVAHVVRCFSGGDVAYQLSSVDPVKELDVVGTELMLSDLQVVEKVREKSSGGEEHEKLLRRLHDSLAAGRPLRQLDLSDEEKASAAGYQMLSLKPLVVVANVGENRLKEEAEWVESALRRAREMGAEGVVICGKIESEIAELPDSEADIFLEEWGLSGRALSRFVRKCYSLLGLITFFTVEGGIVQAWAVPRGTAARRAAGRIHSDMERGFIKAEVIGFEELDSLGGMAKAREKGRLRLEGRDYVVQDGDVMRIRFA